MMKKRILLLLLSLTLAFTGITACSRNSGGNSAQESSYSSQEGSSSDDSSVEESSQGTSVSGNSSSASQEESSSEGNTSSSDESSVEEDANSSDESSVEGDASSSDESSSEEETSSSQEEASSSSDDSSSGEDPDPSQDVSAIEELIDFVVEVESGKEPVVLQLSDPQLCYWGNLETYCYGYVREAVEETKPDLILVTGDIVYGKFDENGSLLLSYIEFMESLQIPWAPVFGNHDNECILGVDWQCEQLENAEYCLFKQGDVTGNGNYSVGIKQDEEILRVFYMLDSNGCSNPMIDRNDQKTTPAAGTNIVKTTAGFGQDQINWYTEEINAIHAIDEDVKISFAYHIQQAIFEKAFKKYDEYDGVLATGSSSALKNPVNLDTLETADETDFGYLGRRMKGAWDTNYSVWNGMVDLGVDSVFVGHEHCNSASIVYEGIRLQYGQKSSTYDRYNWVFEDGTIQGDYKEQMPSDAHALMGGTVIPISSQDGTIGTGYIYYSGDPFNFEDVPETPSNPSITQGDSRTTMPEYDGDATTLGFATDTTVYTIDNATPDDVYVDGWNKRAILSAPGTQDFVTVEFVTENDNAASSVFHAWGTNGAPSITHISCNTKSKGIITDMDGNSVSSIKAGTHYLLHVACEDLSEVQIGFVSANNTVYFANISFNNGTLGQITAPEEIVVDGIALTDPQSGVSLTAEAFDGNVNAYKATATAQGKVYIDPSLVANKSTITFTVYVSEILNDTAFMVRIKPNELTEESVGHIYYTPSTVALGTWQTFTVDISHFGDACTEFSFIIPVGQTVWFRDITVK